ncbi:MAG: hypothetical protein ACOYK1_07020 [Vampirovibrionia bacterium]
MRNRFSSREILCDGIGFNPSAGVGGTGSVKQSTSPKAAAAAEGVSNIKAIMDGISSGKDLSQSSNILRSLDLVK